MVIDYTIKTNNTFIILTDLTYKPKVKKLNIQVITPSGKIINTYYLFQKVNIFGENILGNFEKGVYMFNIGGLVKVIDFGLELKMTEVEKAYFRSREGKEPIFITKLKHCGFFECIVKNK